MKKALIIASVASMIDQFNMDNVRILIDLGCEVHIAANFSFGSTSSQKRVSLFREELNEMKIKVIDLPFPRRIGSIKANMSVYRLLKHIIDKNNYSLIHAHSPIGGFITRLAAYNARSKGAKIIYTAHGFHFFKGAPVFNWVFFYPIERFLSKFTDVIITINNEDYVRAQKFHAKKVIYIPSIGINTCNFYSNVLDIDMKKNELGIPLEAFIVLSVGELSKRKNHEVILKAIYEIKDKNIYYIICGRGNEEAKLKTLTNKLGLENNVLFTGFRTDVPEIIKISDCFAFPSKREGFGIAAIEAMASGLPIITSNINGILDYSVDGVTGFVCNPNDVKGFANAIENLYENEALCKQMKQYNLKRSMDFDISIVHRIMKTVYSDAVK